jgi:hypothetical protein
MHLDLTRPSDTYSPLYFLAALGAGGLSVTFFMWLMHWLPHPGRSVPTSRISPRPLPPAAP